MNGVCFPRILTMALQSDPGGSPSVRVIRLLGFPAFCIGTRMGVATNATGIFSNGSRLGFERAVPNIENVLPDVQYTKYIFRLCPRGKSLVAINFWQRSQNFEEVLMAPSCLSFCPYVSVRLPLEVFS